MTSYLWSDAGSGYVLLIEAAVRNHVRPTTMILGSDSRKAWSDLDVLIMQAYEMYKREQCQQCFQPRWLCHNEDPKLQVRIKEDRCFIAAEIEKDKAGRKDEDQHGISLYPEPYHLDGLPLHKLRDSYRQQREAELAEAAEDD